MKNKLALLTLLILILFASGCTNQEVNNDALAKCLTEKDIKMYGTSTCSACAYQKKLFGDSFQYINYIECDPRAENSQYEFCEGIAHVPTWEFPDGQKVVGAQELETLSTLSSCSIQ